MAFCEYGEVNITVGSAVLKGQIEVMWIQSVTVRESDSDISHLSCESVLRKVAQKGKDLCQQQTGAIHREHVLVRLPSISTFFFALDIVIYLIQVNTL